MANYEEIRQKRKQDEFIKTGLFFRYDILEDKASFKSWVQEGSDISSGVKVVTYYAPTDEKVISGEELPGYSWYINTKSSRIDLKKSYGTFNEASKALESFHFLSTFKC